MTDKRSLDRLRDEFDTSQLLEAIDHLDTIRSLLGGGAQALELRDQIDTLHTVASGVINDYELLPNEPDEDIHELIWEIQSVVGDIHDAADAILTTLNELEQLCPTEDDLGEED
jgi:hypothetical protein